MSKLPTFLDLIQTESFDLNEKGMSDAEIAKRDALVDAMAADKVELRKLVAQHGEHWKQAANGIATQQVIDQRTEAEPEEAPAEEPEPDGDLEEDLTVNGLWKPSPKEIQGFLKAKRGDVSMDGITFNDTYNLKTFGITKDVYNKIAKRAADKFGGSFWKGELQSPEHVAALFESEFETTCAVKPGQNFDNARPKMPGANIGSDTQPFQVYEDGIPPISRTSGMTPTKPGVNVAPRKCSCGKMFVPSYGEFKRCPDCLSNQHANGERATGVQEADLTTGQLAKRNQILNTMKPKATQYKNKYGVEGDDMMRADATRKAVSPNPTSPGLVGPQSAADMIEAMFSEGGYGEMLDDVNNDWTFDNRGPDAQGPPETIPVNKRTGTNRREACPARDGMAGDPHDFRNGKPCTFCGKSQNESAVPMMEMPRAPFMPLKGHPYHTKTDDQLKYIIRDAGAAAVNMKGMDNRQAEDKYLDQVNDASTVLYYRRNGGKQVGGSPERVASGDMDMDKNPQNY